MRNRVVNIGCHWKCYTTTYKNSVRASCLRSLINSETETFLEWSSVLCFLRDSTDGSLSILANDPLVKHKGRKMERATECPANRCSLRCVCVSTDEQTQITKTKSWCLLHCSSMCLHRRYNKHIVKLYFPWQHKTNSQMCTFLINVSLNNWPWVRHTSFTAWNYLIFAILNCLLLPWVISATLVV